MNIHFQSLLLSVLILGIALGDYKVGEDYTVNDDPTIWSGKKKGGLEYRLRYLMQADKQIKTVWYSKPKGLTEQQSLNLSGGVNNIDEVLVASYLQATEYLKTHPNPELLKMMLAHYYLYVNSANEAWPPIVAELVRLSPSMAMEIQKDAQARQAEWRRVEEQPKKTSR